MELYYTICVGVGYTGRCVLINKQNIEIFETHKKQIILEMFRYYKEKSSDNYKTVLVGYDETSENFLYEILDSEHSRNNINNTDSLINTVNQEIKQNHHLKDKYNTNEFTNSKNSTTNNVIDLSQARKSNISSEFKNYNENRPFSIAGLIK